MENIIIIAVLIIITALAGLYIYKSKKKGIKCIGCKGCCSKCTYQCSRHE